MDLDGFCMVAEAVANKAEMSSIPWGLPHGIDDLQIVLAMLY